MNDETTIDTGETAAAPAETDPYLVAREIRERHRAALDANAKAAADVLAARSRMASSESLLNGRANGAGCRLAAQSQSSTRRGHDHRHRRACFHAAGHSPKSVESSVRRVDGSDP